MSEHESSYFMSGPDEQSLQDSADKHAPIDVDRIDTAASIAGVVAGSMATLNMVAGNTSAYNERLEARIGIQQDKQEALQSDRAFLREFHDVIFGTNQPGVQLIKNVDTHVPHSDPHVEARSWDFTARYLDQVQKPQFIDLQFSENASPEFMELLRVRVEHHVAVLDGDAQEATLAVQGMEEQEQSIADIDNLGTIALFGIFAGSAALLVSVGSRRVYAKAVGAVNDFRIEQARRANDANAAKEAAMLEAIAYGLENNILAEEPNNEA